MFDIITIGTATRDVFLRSPKFKVLRDPEHLKKLGFVTGEAECFALGSKLSVEAPVFAFGGGAVNAAVTFARQGLTTGALVKVGEDESGDALLAHLKREKITSFAARDKKTASAYSVVLLTAGGERTILSYGGASEDLARRDIPWNKLSARWAYLTPGALPMALMRELVVSLKKRGTSVAMNPSGAYVKMGAEKMKPLLSLLDVVIVNREEATLLTGFDFSKERKIFKRFDDLVPGLAVVTDGPRGAKVSDGRYLYIAETFKEKKLVDRTGAGDAFGAGFVAGLIQKRDVHYALRLASANATAVVEQVGAQEGILTAKNFTTNRFKYLSLDVEPL
ncbi:MAG: carbohydrate kinase family protein [Candidatus Brennerbacteria bacterium]|nr:carbohydrate kinase family protein [Candidatus Brennerbacteria bacterium]